MTKRSFCTRVTLIEKLPDRFAHLPSLPVGNRNLAVILGSAGIALTLALTLTMPLTLAYS